MPERPASQRAESEHEPDLKAKVWNHAERMKSDPAYRARYEVHLAQPWAECSVPGCDRTSPCATAESGWCGLA